MRFYKHKERYDTFNPEAHEWLVEYEGQYLFVMKPSDRWSDLTQATLDKFSFVEKGEVPATVRRKAGHRLGGLKGRLSAYGRAGK